MTRRILAAVLGVAGLLLLPSAAYAGPYLYVCDKVGRQVTVIDTATDTVVDTIDVPGEPHDIGFTPDGLHAYVSLYDSGKAIEIDTVTKSLSPTITIGGKPQGVVVRPDGAVVYITSSLSHSVYAIDTATNQVLSVIQVGTDPDGITNRPFSSEVWTANASNGPPAPPPNSRNSASVISTTTNTEIARLGVGHAPRRVVFKPDGSRGYTANGSSNDVSIINTDAKKTIGRMSSGGIAPRGITISPDGSTLWVANDTSANVVKIDLATQTIVANIPMTYRSHRLTMLPDGSKIYVNHPLDDRISVIDTATASVLYTIRVGKQPGGMGVQPVPHVDE